MNILMVSLGCDKNLCDSEAMLGLLRDNNFNITNDEAEADIVVVNTCSFINDAMEESVNTVLEMAELKKERLNKLMSIQENISFEINQSKIGHRLNVIIDSEDEEYYIGRTEWDSPEVDPEVLIYKTSKLNVGEFYNVEILDALPFELIAKVVD